MTRNIPHVEKVIHIRVPRGHGTECDPCRLVDQFYTLDGEFVAERDPSPPLDDHYEGPKFHSGSREPGLPKTVTGYEPPESGVTVERCMTCSNPPQRLEDGEPTHRHNRIREWNDSNAK